MGKRVLIVEGHFLITLSIEDTVIELGHQVCGIAASEKEVAKVADEIDIALVDVNPRDGSTGPEIGRCLASRGCRVIFMTGNPEMVADGVEGTLGVLAKPVRDGDLIDAIKFAASKCDGGVRPPPLGFRAF